MRKKIVTTLLMSVFAFGTFSNLKFVHSQSIDKFVPVSATDYYSSITDDMSGQVLLNKLHNIITSGGVSQSYSWDRYEEADEDPNNKNNVILIYARTSDPKNNHVSGNSGWNREHTFPQSKMDGGSGSKSDNHIIFASDNKVNGARSNIKMGVVNNGTIVKDYHGNDTTCQKTSSLFDPHNVARGIVSRSTMYAAAMYNYDPLDNIESLKTMLEWHFEYPSNEDDMRRNEVVYGNQHNRNPFVDHPEYACRIWGNANSATQSICAQYSKPTLSISTESLNVYVDKEAELSGSMSDNSPIEWKIEDETIAQISSISEDKKNISIAGIKEGTTKITLSGHGEDDELLTKTCSITVSEINLTGITVSNQKTKYLIGDQFVKPDVIARFSDNSTENVKETASFTGFDSSTVGEKTINVSYTFNGVTKQASYKVTVSEEPEERVLSDIYFSSRPSKLEYKVGEKFDPTGLEVTAMYENGEEEVVTDKVVYETPTLDKAGEVHIIFSYTEGEITKTRGLVITVKGDKVPAKNGCGGNIATTSIVLTSIAAFGIATIIISNILRKKRK